MINVIEKENLNWRCGETKDLQIKYTDWQGQERNYFADFLIDERYLIEIKPKRLRNSPSILAKEKGAIEFCHKKGYIYQIIDPPRLTNEQIKIMHQEGQVKFTDRYEKLFQEKYAEDVYLLRNDL